MVSLIMGAGYAGLAAAIEVVQPPPILGSPPGHRNVNLFYLGDATGHELVLRTNLGRADRGVPMQRRG